MEKEPENISQRSLPDLSNVENINNLDTARMALRWALERLHALQRDKAHLTETLERQTQDLSQAQEDIRALRSALAIRSQEASERELYYSKMEAFVSSRLAGNLDVAELAKREVQVAQLQDFLHDRQANLEKEFAAKREALEKQFSNLKFEVEQEAAGRVQRAEDAVLERRKGLDSAHVERLSQLNEMDIGLRAREQALADRERRFNEFYASQRSQLDREIKVFAESIEDQVKFRLQNAERFMSARHDSLEGGWAQEKTILLKELADWRHKAQESLPQLLNLERLQAEATEGVKLANNAAQRLREREHALESEKRTLLDELDRERERTRQVLPQMLDLERRLKESQEANERFEVSLSEESKRRSQSEKREIILESEFSSRFDALEGEYQRRSSALAQRRNALDAIESVLSARFADIEKEIIARDKAWNEREEFLRGRDQGWHERFTAWQSQVTEKSDQLEVLKEKLLEAIQSYKNRLREGRDGSNP